MVIFKTIEYWMVGAIVGFIFSVMLTISILLFFFFFNLDIDLYIIVILLMSSFVLVLAGAAKGLIHGLLRKELTNSTLSY